LETTDPQGQPIGNEVNLGPIRLAGKEPDIPADAISSSCHLGGQITLVGYRWVEPMPSQSPPAQLTLLWQASAPVTEDVKVFVHLMDRGGKIIYQKDNPPRQGRYPTSLWQPGQTIVDEYELPLAEGLPAGGYTLRVGMYRPDGGARLPVLDAHGNRQAEDFITLAGPALSRCASEPAVR